MRYKLTLEVESFEDPASLLDTLEQAAEDWFGEVDTDSLSVEPVQEEAAQ